MIQRSVINNTIAVVVVVLLLSACSGGGKTSFYAQGGDTVRFRYLENLTLVDYEDYMTAEIRNPWDTSKVLHKYVLIEKNDTVSQEIPNATIVRIPLSKTVVYTSVHSALIDDLGALEQIAGVCDVKYIMRPCILEQCAGGRIADVGDAMTPDVERIIQLTPDAILLSPFENSGGYGRFEKYGIPIVECADYMEKSALARAEWMRFYGLLYGKGKEADSLFSSIERRYKELKALVAEKKNGPQLLCDLKGGAAWYVPGGKSYLGQLYNDAGGNYSFDYLDDSGSVPLSFEAVYDKAVNADVWLIKYNTEKDKTYSSLLEEYSPYSAFKAFRERNIYGCNTGEKPFYEEVPFHPDRLLEEFIKIFHPGVLENDSLRFFRKLAE